MLIEKPLLAGNFSEKKAKFPYIGTPKIDGIRFLMVNGVAVSRTFKPIRNVYVQNLLQKYLPDGIDGELTSGETFQSSTSGIMTIEGEPEFKVWIFDYVNPSLNHIEPYTTRLNSIPEISDDLNHEILRGVLINNFEELLSYEEHCVFYQGFEGIMLRDPQGTYKFGRSTQNDNILLKVKRFLDDEAELIDIHEKMSNQNPEELNAFGNIKRSACLDGLIPAGVAGSLLVRDKCGNEFSIGSGLNDELRKDLWDNKHNYIGKLVKYKYFPHGIKTLPRHPVFLGFRDPEDL